MRACTNVTTDLPVPDDTIHPAHRSSPGLDRSDGLLREDLAMPTLCRVVVSLAVGVFLCAVAVRGQDQPSLGDVARQARLQKQQRDADASKDTAAPAPGKDAASKDAPATDSRRKDSAAKDVQSEDAQAHDAQPSKGKRVLTNEEIPEHIVPTRTLPKTQAPGGSDEADENTGAAPAEYWKGQILAAKNNITSLQGQIGSLSDSIQYAGANCVSNCVQWNEHQQQKQQQVETMKQQLDQAQKQLEDLQDTARKQGFGSAVYDP
jgi:hypothetical protein